MGNPHHVNDRSAKWWDNPAQSDIPRTVTDEGSSTAEVQHTRQYVWNSVSLAWDRMTQPGGVGGGGGGPATIADGADVAQGTTTDASSANTVIGILKAIKAAVQGVLSVSGTVTSNIGTTNGLALDATLTGGTQKAIARSAAKGTTVAGDITSEATDVNTQSMHVRMTNTSVAVTGTFWQATQPVSGTFWQATQPVSIAAAVTVAQATAANLLATVTQGPAGATAWKVDGSAVTQPVSIAAAVTVAQATASSLNATVTQQAITKGTQGTTGVTTQDLKDAGRSARTITVDGFQVAAATETLLTLSFSTDNAALTTGTSYPVTAAKRLRIQSITAALHSIAGNTTNVVGILRIRANNGGAALVTSPVQVVAVLPGTGGANQAAASVNIPIPDGWEFVAGAGIGVTVTVPGFVATTAAPKISLTITAYEY